MRFDAVISLIVITYEKDDIGNQIAVPKARRIYANEFAVGASEFYAAGQNGLQADCEYQIHSADYKSETLMSVGGVDYTVIRASKKGEWTRLVGQRKVSDE